MLSLGVAPVCAYVLVFPCVGVWACGRVRLCVCACVCVSRGVHVCWYVCVRVCVHVMFWCVAVRGFPAPVAFGRCVLARCTFNSAWAQVRTGGEAVGRLQG